MKATQLENALASLLNDSQLIQLREILDFFSYKSPKAWYEKNKHKFQDEIDYSSKFIQLKKEYQEKLSHFLLALSDQAVQLNVMAALIRNGKEDFVLSCIKILENKTEPQILEAIEKSFAKMSLPAQKLCTKYLQDHGGTRGYNFLNKVATQNKKISCIAHQSLRDTQSQNEEIVYLEGILKDSLKNPDKKIEPHTLLFYLKTSYPFKQRISILRKLSIVEPEIYKEVYVELAKDFESTPKPSNPKKEYLEHAVLVLLFQDNLGIPIKEDLIKQYITTAPEEKNITFPYLTLPIQRQIISLSLDGSPNQKQWMLHYLLNTPELTKDIRKSLTDLTREDSILTSALASTLLLKESEQHEKSRLQTIITTYLINEPKSESTLIILSRYLESLPINILNTLDLLSKELRAFAQNYILSLPQKKLMLESILNSKQSLSLEEAEWIISTIADCIEDDENQIAFFAEKLSTSMSKKDLGHFLLKNPKVRPYVERQLLYLALRKGFGEEIDWQNPLLLKEINYIANNLIQILRDHINQCLYSKTKEISFANEYQNNDIILKLLRVIQTRDIKNLEENNLAYLNKVREKFNKYFETSLSFFSNFMKKVQTVLPDENDESYIMLEGYIEEMSNQLESLSLKDFMSGELQNSNQFVLKENIDQILADYRTLQLEIRFLENKLADLSENLSLHFIGQFAQSIEKIQILLAKNEQLLESELLNSLIYWIEQLGLKPIESKLGICVRFDPRFHLGSGFEQLDDSVFVLTSGLKTPSGTVLKQVLVNKME